jgi:hypothetical protein
MSFVHLAFHPAWWAAKGFGFTRRFFEEPAYRIETDRSMRRVLHEAYGHMGLGEKDPKPRPLLGSPFVSAEYLQSEILGCEISFAEDDFPIIHPLNASFDTLRQLNRINPCEQLSFLRLKAQLAALYAQYGYVESYLDLHGVQNLALDVRGNDLYEDYYFDQETAHLAIKAAYRCIAAVNAQLREYTPYLSLGAAPLLRQTSPLVSVTSNCTCEMISQQIYRQFLQKYDKALAHGHPFGIHHCGCTMHNIAEAYAELRPDYLEIGSRSELDKALRPFAKSTIVNLRMTADELDDAEAAKIERETVQKLQHVKAFAHYGITCAAIREKTPPQKLEAFVHAAMSV